MIKTKPNLPEAKVKMLIATERLCKDSVSCLKAHSIEIIFSRNIKTADKRLLHHIDLGMCLANDGVLYVCPSLAGNFDIPGIIAVKGSADPGDAYPKDCGYNVCMIGKYAIHDFEHTDRDLYRYLNDRYELINIKQGYAKCMISVVTGKCVITQDGGIAKKLEKTGFDVLHIDERNIRLEGFPYGFIGGASFLLDENTWCINGSLEKLDSCYNIENTLTKMGIGIVCLNDDFPLDVGSFIQLFEEERCYEKKS